MNFKQLIEKNRSYRRFYQEEYIDYNDLKKLIELARLSPSAKNIQPLKFYISNTSDENEKIFSCLKWAGYLTDWDGPEEGEKPSAYIIILSDNSILNSVKWDDAIAAQSILLGATEMALGGCMIASINKDKLKKLIPLSNQFEIHLVIAIGKPKEKVVIDIPKNGNIRYWRDKAQVHHVPKRPLNHLLINPKE